VLLTWLTALTVGSSALAIGAVHPTVRLAVLPFALLAGVLAVGTARLRYRELPAPAIVLGLLALYTALQTLPLPFSLLARLSPAAADVWEMAARPFGESAPAFASLSVDPTATWGEALKWLGYAAIFLAASELGRRKSARAGAVIVFGSAIAVALVTVAHGLLDLDRVYGFYEPIQARPTWALSPLLNTNNLAGYMNLGAFCGLGLLFARAEAAPRWLLLLGVTPLFAVAVLTGSRGGFITLCIGFVVLVAALRFVQRRVGRGEAKRVPSWAPLAAAVLVVSLFVALGGNDNIWAALLDESTAKLAIVDWTRGLLSAYPWFGVGRGAFGTAFAAHRQGQGAVIYEYAESFPAHWASEWGIPVAAIALVAFVWLLRPRRLRAFWDPTAAAVFVGCLTLLLQNLVDLSLELASFGLALTAALGALHGAAHAASEKETPLAASNPTAPSAPPGVPMTWFRRTIAALPAWTLLLLGVSFTVMVARTGLRSALADRHALTDRFHATRFEGRDSATEFWRELRAGINRHPADPHLPVLGALAAQASGKDPLPWISQALRRDPLNARAHFLLAEPLYRRGAKAQGLLALRLAAQHDRSLHRLVAERVVAWNTDPASFAAVVPEGAEGAALLLQLVQELGRVRRDVESSALLDRLLEQAITRAPDQPGPYAIRARRTLAALARSGEDAPCAGERRAACLETLTRNVHALVKLRPDSADAVLLRAELLIAQGRARDAERMLSLECAKLRTSTECFRKRVELLVGAEDRRGLKDAVNAYLGAACSTSRSCAAAAIWLGNAMARQKDWGQALQHYERAAREEPSGEVWLKVAEAASHVGAYTRANAALTHARKHDDVPGPQLEKRATAIVERMAVERTP
jgi:tetratricopeptide (TPR) repeat protein